MKTFRKIFIGALVMLFGSWVNMQAQDVSADANTIVKTVKHASSKSAKEKRAKGYLATHPGVVEFISGISAKFDLDFDCSFKGVTAKASNIMVTGNGEVKIIDYDAAKIYKPDSSGDTTHLGTDGVAAPEQYGFMQSDTRSDVYAVGKMLANAFPDNKRIQTIAAKASSFDPRDRYANAGELSDVLSGKVCLKSKLKNPFPPPGYRTRKLWKMIVASLGYPFLVVWTVTFDGRKDPLVNFGLKLFWAVFILVAIDICCSWTGIFDLLPFITHKNPFLRGLFKALFVTASAIVIMLLIVILLTIIALATDAYAV